jgi:hypothetical protein
VAIAKVADRANVNGNAAVTTVDLVLSSLTVGNTLIIRTSADNSGGGGAARTITVTNQSGTPIDLGALQAFQQNNDPGAASAGVTCNVIVAPITATSGTVRLTYSGSVVQSVQAEEWSDISTVTPIVGTPVGANGVNSVNMASLTDASVAVNNCVYVALAVEGPAGDTLGSDSDTTNGSWVDLTKRGTTNGTADTNQTIAGAYKIATGTGAQTYNVTNSVARDSAGIILEFQGSIPVSITAPLATASASALVPTISGNAVVSTTPATASASMLAVPISVEILSPTSTSSATAIAPTIDTQSNVQIDAPTGTASGEFVVPTIAGEVVLGAPIASATAQVWTPTIEAIRQVDVAAPVMTATTSELTPVLAVQFPLGIALGNFMFGDPLGGSTSEDISVAAPKATATATFVTPRLALNVYRDFSTTYAYIQVETPQQSTQRAYIVSETPINSLKRAYIYSAQGLTGSKPSFIGGTTLVRLTKSCYISYMSSLSSAKLCYMYCSLVANGSKSLYINGGGIPSSQPCYLVGWRMGETDVTKPAFIYGISAVQSYSSMFEMYVSGHVLSTTKIVRAYISSNDPIGHWKLDDAAYGEPQLYRFNDSTTNDNDGHLLNSPVWVEGPHWEGTCSA